MVQDGRLVVPVLAVIRQLARVGRADVDVSAGQIFGQLERLRSLQREVAVLNAASDADIEDDAVLSDRVERLLQLLAIFGGAMPSDRRLNVTLPGVPELVAVLEHEFATVVKSAREAVAEEGNIEYMGLQELYKIGDVVKSDTIGELGGANAFFRVIDSFYEPYRSLFGHRRYSYKVVLETVVSVGDDFLATSFEMMIGDWLGGKDVTKLDFKTVTQAEIDEVVKRRMHVAELMEAPAYRRYRPGTFMPRRARATEGSAASDHNAASGGYLVVDTSAF